MNIPPAILNPLKLLAVVYCSICLLMYFFQRSLLYFPVARNAVALDASSKLEVSGATLNIVQVKRNGARALLYFGGNAEDVSYSVAEFAELFPEHSIYGMNYRGYAGSTGSPSETALHADAAALFEQVHQSHSQILLVGRSLGSAMAIRLASEKPVERLVLVTPFDSVLNLAGSKFPWLPVSWLLKDRYESWRVAPQVSAPTLILIAEKDEVIPTTSSLALANAFAPGRAQTKTIVGVGHNNISYSSEYLNSIREGK